MRITTPLNTRRAIAARIATTLSLLGATTIAIGASMGSAQAFASGLSVSPSIVEHTAKPGGVGAITVTNTTTSAMTVRIALRPWLQSRSGEASPNRRRTLSEVRPTASSFPLSAGSSRSVGILLTRRPSGGSQYGAVEITGTPTRRVNNGINVAYRIVNSLRLDAPNGSQAYRAQVGGLVEQGSVKHGALLLAVRNTGNTIAPIGGSVRISGQGHSLRSNATSKVIVPGATVNVALVQLLGSLPRGRYTVSTRLSQGGHGLGTFTRTVNLR
jgi:hypothetical protein